MTWQVAGDLLPNATCEQKLAITFSLLHSQKAEGGSIEEDFRVEYVSDRLHTFGTAFLGFTMECCRCHDHKYDPISTKTYYEMSSFFANVDEAGLYSFFNSNAPPPTTLALTTKDQDKKITSTLTAVKSAERNLTNVQKSERSNFETWLLTSLDRPEIPAWKEIQTHLTFDSLVGGKFANSAVAKSTASNNAANKLIPAGVNGSAVKLTGDRPIQLTSNNADCSMTRS